MMKNSALNLVRKVPINQMPISLEDAKSFLRIQNENDDELLRFLIAVSTDYAQWFTETSLAEQTWQLTIDYETIPQKIYLPYGPLISITSITALKSGNKVCEVIDSDRYFVDVRQSYVTLPVLLDASEVEIVYVSGHVSQQTVPTQIRYGILHHTAVSYKNRDHMDVKHLAFLKEIYFPFRALKLVL